MNFYFDFDLAPVTVQAGKRAFVVAKQDSSTKKYALADGG